MFILLLAHLSRFVLFCLKLTGEEGDLRKYVFSEQEPAKPLIKPPTWYSGTRNGDFRLGFPMNARGTSHFLESKVFRVRGACTCC